MTIYKEKASDMKRVVKSFNEFIKENMELPMEQDNEDLESNDPDTEAFLDNYMIAIENLDSKVIE